MMNLNGRLLPGAPVSLTSHRALDFSFRFSTFVACKMRRGIKQPQGWALKATNKLELRSIVISQGK
jgi:hypothetical protein